MLGTLIFIVYCRVRTHLCRRMVTTVRVLSSVDAELRKLGPGAAGLLVGVIQGSTVIVLGAACPAEPPPNFEGGQVGHDHEIAALL